MVCQYTDSEVRYTFRATSYVLPCQYSANYRIDCTGNRATTFIRYFTIDGIPPDYGINRIKHTGLSCLYFGSIRSVNLLYLPRLGYRNSLPSRLLISRVLFPVTYRLIMRFATFSAKIVSHFLMNWGLKLELRLLGEDTITSLNGVWTCFCIFSLRLLPI